jgi:hypothetical protein
LSKENLCLTVLTHATNRKCQRAPGCGPFLGPSMTEACTTGSKYPQLPVESSAAIARKLIEVVSLYHCEALSTDQLDAVRTCVAAQLAATERLHRFPLTNDREPIFTVGTHSGIPA